MAAEPKGRNKARIQLSLHHSVDSHGCDRTTGSSVNRGLRSGPWESEEGEGIGLVTDKVILRLVQLFALKGWVGVGLFSFVNQHSEKRLVSPG